MADNSFSGVPKCFVSNLLTGRALRGRRRRLRETRPCRRWAFPRESGCPADTKLHRKGGTCSGGGSFTAMPSTSPRRQRSP